MLSAINATTVKISISSEINEEQLAGKQVTLTTGNTEVTATYMAASLNIKGEATFKLDGEATLVDAASYATAANWATITNGEFVAKVATAYVAGFEKVTTGIAATPDGGGNTTVTFSATNQYGEEIAAPTANTTVKVTVNGMTLTDSEATYTNGVVTITPAIAENDVVVITLKHTDGAETPKTLAEGTFEYTVVKAAAAKVTTVKVNPAKTSLPAQEATALNVAVLDQFNNTLTGPNAAVRYQVNGTVVTPGADTAPIKLVDGKPVFQTSTPGTYVIEVFSTVDTKVKASTTITVGAATLTGLTVAQPEEVVTASDKHFNNEEIILATVAPSTGAALTPANLKFNVTSTTPGLTAADVTVTAETKTIGEEEVIVIKATSSKAGSFTVTPYVGESFITEGIVTGDSVTFTTSVNPTVAAISDFTFDAKALKAGATNVLTEVVFTNKHGEVLNATQAAASVVTSNKDVTGETPVIVDGTGDNLGKTYVKLPTLATGTALVTVQKGDVLKSVQVKVVAATLSTIDAGADVAGVVAGDDDSFAKYNEVKFLDQDGVSLSESTPTVKVRKAGATEDLSVGAAAKLVTAGTAVKDDKGVITGLAGQTTNINAIKVHPQADVAEGTYTVTVSKVVGEKTISDSFTVTVGAARALTTVETTTTVTTIGINGTTKILVTPKDQYGQVVAGATVALTANATVAAGSFSAKDDEKGNLLGYEATITGNAKGTVNAEFVVTKGEVSKKATKSFTVDAVGNLAASVEVKNPGLLYANNLVTGKQLEAIVKDANGNAINVASEDLTWEASTVEFKDAKGEVVAQPGATVTLSKAGSLTLTGTLAESVKTITFVATAETANLKTGSTTIELSTEAPKLAGDLAVVSTTADKVLDADATKAGIQISLDGDAKDGEVLVGDTAGTISVKLEGEDQYGNKAVDFNELAAKVSTNDGTIAKIATAAGAITITPQAVGTTQVHIQFGGKTVSLDVTVTEGNAIIAKQLADAALVVTKTNAKNALDSYVVATDYTTNADALAAAILTGKSNIDAATTPELVATALATAKLAMDAIKSDAQLAAELALAKTNAIQALEEYKNAADYTKNAVALTTAIEDGKTAINAAADEAAVTEAIDAAKIVIDAIQNDVQEVAVIKASLNSVAWDTDEATTLAAVKLAITEISAAVVEEDVDNQVVITITIGTATDSITLAP